MNIFGLHGNPDREQMAKLFRDHYTLLCLYANRMVNDRQAAEDIVQDCFTKLWQKREEMKNVRFTKAYLFTAVRNHALNYTRDHKRAIDINYIEVTSNEHILHNIIEAETVHQLYRAVQKLPPQCREVFRLYYIEGMEHEEVARLMNITASTVRNQKAKGISILRRLLPGL